MKLLGLDADNNSKSQNFFDQAEKILDIEIIRVPVTPVTKIIESNYLYENLSVAGFALEEFVTNDSRYFTSNKPYINAIYSFGQYSLDGIEKLRPYQQIFLENLLIIQNGTKAESDWIFGNIISVIKWSSSLFKIKSEWFPDSGRDAVTGASSLSMAIWYATRIGLDVRSSI